MAMRKRKVDKSSNGRTVQSAEAEANIHNIFAQYRKGTGELAHIREGLEVYRDVSNIPDFQTLLNMHAQAMSYFSALPSEIRAACDHNPGNFIDFIDDEDNHEMARQYGLFNEAKSVPNSLKKETPNPITEEANPPTPKPGPDPS